jgi:hypothetical protein
VAFSPHQMFVKKEGGRLVGRSVACLVVWLVGWLVACLLACLVGRSRIVMKLRTRCF